MLVLQGSHALIQRHSHARVQVDRQDQRDKVEANGVQQEENEIVFAFQRELTFLHGERLVQQAQEQGLGLCQSELGMKMVNY